MKCADAKLALPCRVMLVSISPTFYEQLFCTQVFSAAFMYLQFGFVIFLAKEYWLKSCSYNVGEIDYWATALFTLAHSHTCTLSHAHIIW